ncbi:mannose-6-phosphate isomerase [Bradyrhizobium erythrophlei]|jgi:mannose-6-phosphate isomerase|nr:mannose-6-phosphate isomerase [Bradyrhizobium erythrophlei]
MPIEYASVRAMHKPWGVSDLQPWSDIDGTGDAVGELWFERADGENAPVPALLLKLLFTSGPLSIQVHPDDTFARAMGMPNGKSEAWYIIAAEPDAQIGIGLKHRVTPQELRASIANGSIVDLVQWRPVAKGDVIFIPAGTIHALGAGIVLAEIQQRSDTTFRLFDYDRARELHIDNGVAVANAWPLRPPADPIRLTDERTVLVASRHFVLERVELQGAASWALLAEPETWILVLDGHAAIGVAAVSIGQAVFVGGGRSSIEVGINGLSALIAYPAARPIASLLQRLCEPSAQPVQPAAPDDPKLTGPAKART